MRKFNVGDGLEITWIDSMGWRRPQSWYSSEELLDNCGTTIMEHMGYVVGQRNGRLLLASGRQMEDGTVMRHALPFEIPLGCITRLRVIRRVKRAKKA